MYKKWKWFVYILELNNGRFYTGMTWKPDVRYEQQLSKKYTTRHGDKKLVYLEEHDDIEIARRREKQIKDTSQKNSAF